jgi:DNA-binding transcriptional ArsR family regulator
MNVLAQLVCSRVRAEIFRVLFGLGAEELHLREIQRQTGLALGTVRQDIGKLVKLGLLTRRQDGNRVYYAANPSHPLSTEIRQLVLKTVGLADVLGAALKAHGIRCAFVFGSVASGAARSESDIDLMVIGDIGLRKVSALLSGVGNRLGREINPHVMSPAEFVKRLRDRDHFLTSVMASTRIFAVGSEDELETARFFCARKATSHAVRGLTSISAPAGAKGPAAMHASRSFAPSGASPLSPIVP